MFNAHEFAARLSNRQDHWPLLEGWADAWCQSFRELDGYSEVEIERAEDRLGLALPASLKQLHGFAAHSLSKLNDPLIKPEDLEIAQNILPFWSENQYVVTWGVRLDDLSLDDPPISIDFNGCDSFKSTFTTVNRLIQQNDTLSEFVLQMVLWDYMKWGMACSTAGTEDDVVQLLQTCQPLGFPDWTQEHFQRGQGFRNVAVRFYGNEANLVLVTADKYARCVPRNKDNFLRHTTKGG